MYTQNPDQQQDLFIEPNLVQASSGKRLANYLIDLVIFYIAFFLIFFSIYYTHPSTVDDLNANDSIGFDFMNRLISLLLYGTYMGLMETLFKGKSIGKFITGTKAVNHDGTQISAKTAFLRGMSRAVPFNAFSALGQPPYPWHDKWNNTYVIDEKKSQVVV